MAADRDGPQLVTPPERLYRVGFSEDVSQFTPWKWQKGAARWDDPLIAEIRRRVAASLGVEKSNEDDNRVDDEFVRTVDGIPHWHRPFRVLYTATTRRAAFVEVLQDYRRVRKSLSLRALARLTEIEQNSAEIAHEPLTGIGTGVVPAKHFNEMHIGEVTLADCTFADLEHVRSVQFVRLPLLGEARRHDLGDVNRGSILGNVRAFTQALSAWLYFDFDARPLAGIRHDSTLGQPHQNWAVFESVGVTTTAPRTVIHRRGNASVWPDDPDLLGAMIDLGIRIEGRR